MKISKKLLGWLLIVLAIVLGIADLFVPGIILALVGIVMAASSGTVKTEPAPKPAPKQPSKSTKLHWDTPYSPEVPGAPATDAYAYSGSVEEYFEGLLQGCLPSYQVLRDVPPSRMPLFESQLSGAPAYSRRNIDFLLCKNGTPVLAILLCKQYSWKTVPIRNTMEDCSRVGVPCLRFIREFRNAAQYCLDRIRSALG